MSQVSAGATADPFLFRHHLITWYRLHARELPWRGIHDPYRTWVSEVMLQQTRVAAVIDHYRRFLDRFPSLEALAAASESDVLTAWSGLGYYRRARMMHRAAQFVTQELAGILPRTAAELRTLPGIGSYTSAAIASIAFGESIAVVDGNVERVLLRILGQAEEPNAASRASIQQTAAALIPEKSSNPRVNAPGDHNQAMMELGATVCLPRNPLCLHCPVFDLCRTRGEHPAHPRAKPVSRPAAYLLELRTRSGQSEILLEHRPPDTTLMPGMYELPQLPLDATADRTPVLSLRHAITTTLYTVDIFSPAHPRDRSLRQALPASPRMLGWTPTTHLGTLPLTGLTRKVLRRLKLMHVPPPR